MFARTALAFVISSGLMSGQAFAFSCGGPPISVIAAEADGVFAGEIVRVDYLDDDGRIDAMLDGPCGAHIATVAVELFWQGEVGEEVRIYSDDACVWGGYYMEAGVSAAFALGRGWLGDLHESVAPVAFSATHCADAVLYATEEGWQAEYMPFVDEPEKDTVKQ
jgi:hypothetical protein